MYVAGPQPLWGESVDVENIGGSRHDMLLLFF
jgi:hypothetical protein